MLSTIHMARMQEVLQDKIIDLRKYNYVDYKIYQYNENNELQLNIRPMIQLIEVLKQMGYIWGNGLGLHINNFSDLTEQGKLNREILKTHPYIVFDGNHINLVYNYRGKVDLEETKITTIESVLDYFFKYNIEEIGIKFPDINGLMIGDIISIDDEQETYYEIKGFEYERHNSYCPSRYIVKRVRKMLGIRGHNLEDEIKLSYLDMKNFIRDNKIKEISRIFQGKKVLRYKREIYGGKI